jgi:hypothetical protein
MSDCFLGGLIRDWDRLGKAILICIFGGDGALYVELQITRTYKKYTPCWASIYHFFFRRRRRLQEQLHRRRE